MKKVLKLAVVFLAIVSIFVGVQFLGKDDINVETEEYGMSPFEALGLRIKQEWDAQKGWNAQLFSQHLNEIDEKYKFNGIDQDQRQLLTENVCSYAVCKTDSALLAEWSKPLCDRAQINRQYEGVRKINGTGYLPGDQRIDVLSRMKRTYDEIYGFIDGTLLHPTLCKSTEVNNMNDWGFWDSTGSDISNKVENYRKLPEYNNYFSRIHYINDNFSNSSKYISEAKDNYYFQLISNLLQFSKDKIKDQSTNIAIFTSQLNVLINSFYNRVPK